MTSTSEHVQAIVTALRDGTETVIVEVGFPYALTPADADEYITTGTVASLLSSDGYREVYGHAVSLEADAILAAHNVIDQYGDVASLDTIDSADEQLLTSAIADVDAADPLADFLEAAGTIPVRVLLAEDVPVDSLEDAIAAAGLEAGDSLRESLAAMTEDWAGGPAHLVALAHHTLPDARALYTEGGTLDPADIALWNPRGGATALYAVGTATVPAGRVRADGDGAQAGVIGLTQL